MLQWPPELPQGVDYRDIQHPVLSRATVHNEPVVSLMRAFARGDLRIPDYQRPTVWTEEQQARFVGFMLSGAPTPCIYIREVDSKHGFFEDEIVDGQQRLKALLAFENGLIPAWHSSSNYCVWKEKMSWPGWRLSHAFPVARFRSTRSEAMSLYLAVNYEGTPHTQGELDRVRKMLQEERS